MNTLTNAHTYMRTRSHICICRLFSLHSLVALLEPLYAPSLSLRLSLSVCAHTLHSRRVVQPALS